MLRGSIWHPDMRSTYTCHMSLRDWSTYMSICHIHMVKVSLPPLNFVQVYTQSITRQTIVHSWSSHPQKCFPTLTCLKSYNLGTNHHWFPKEIEMHSGTCSTFNNFGLCHLFTLFFNVDFQTHIYFHSRECWPSVVYH